MFMFFNKKNSKTLYNACVTIQYYKNKIKILLTIQFYFMKCSFYWLVFPP